jgi:hypothetical protein
MPPTPHESVADLSTANDEDGKCPLAISRSWATVWGPPVYGAEEFTNFSPL